MLAAALSVPLLFFDSIGWQELVVVGLLAVVLFGKRLPDLGRTLGKSLVSFRKGVEEMKNEIVSAADESTDTQPAKKKETTAQPHEALEDEEPPEEDAAAGKPADEPAKDS